MIKSKLIYTLVVLLVVACQKEELNVTVPRDDFSVVPGYADNVKGQLQVKFRELSQDLEVTPTAAGLETDNDELTEAVNRIGGMRMERLFPYAGKFEARTRKAGLHLWYKIYFDEEVNLDLAARVCLQLMPHNFLTVTFGLAGSGFCSMQVLTWSVNSDRWRYLRILMWLRLGKLRRGEKR